MRKERRKREETSLTEFAEHQRRKERITKRIGRKGRARWVNVRRDVIYKTKGHIVRQKQLSLQREDAEEKEKRNRKEKKGRREGNTERVYYANIKGVPCRARRRLPLLARCARRANIPLFPLFTASM